MDYLLDTNICIYYLKGQFDIEERIRKVGFEKFAISEITLAELVYGAEKSQKKDKNIKVVEDFAEKISILPIFEAIRIYGKEKARLKTNEIPNLTAFTSTPAPRHGERSRTMSRPAHGTLNKALPDPETC